ncbi:hypothetical protein M441DRAFT_263142 [Trichoderma asperellum CBS 433.97]|uniref:Uncharacterized protein n=1 Tax=Trichoderma asperellum (strain ATCC 204424 / CBS 433.97 / NBRC 101777) TaxID=1042311 RepID=A0A2T3YXC3_TRIA4|nr:hypothetical protein M441DRAFT_263142 [Trichoderma asperellum CBS 433.97]PTB37187.1 hypothetical protein M441DRAFT_263142 [Trichoderma asperellum CBS 433.97]
MLYPLQAYKTWRQKANKQKRYHWIGHLGAQTAIGLDGIRPQEDLCFYLLLTGWKWKPKIEAHTHTKYIRKPSKINNHQKKKKKKAAIIWTQDGMGREWLILSPRCKPGSLAHLFWSFTKQAFSAGICVFTIVFVCFVSAHLHLGRFHRRKVSHFCLTTSCTLRCSALH